MKSHLQSYPCPLQINSFWNLGFLLGITIILQIITGIFLGLHYTSDLNSAYFSVFFIIREIYYGWCLRYLHSSSFALVNKDSITISSLWFHFYSSFLSSFTCLWFSVKLCFLIFIGI